MITSLHIIGVKGQETNVMDEIKKYASFETEVIANGKRENLKTILVKRGVEGDYDKYTFNTEEVQQVNGRLGTKKIKDIVVPKQYLFIYNSKTKIVLLSGNRRDANHFFYLLQERLTEKSKIELYHKTIDIQKLIKKSYDIKGASFKNLQIETLKGTLIWGQNVNNTTDYLRYDKNGNLSSLIIFFNHKNMDIKTNISSNGTVSFYTSLDFKDLVDFLETLIFPNAF